MTMLGDLSKKTIADLGEAERIITATAALSGFTIRDLASPRRAEPLVAYRHAAMWLIRKNTELSYPKIGRLFNRDHSTVIAAVAKVDARLHFDRGLRRLITDIRREAS